MADYECIRHQAELKALVKDLLRERTVAVDTEADSFYHYYDKTCLVQVSSTRGVYLIDPLELGGPAELEPLAPVMAAPKIRKVFHAAEYDLFVLTRDCGFRFAGLFDTMISAQLLGYPSVGLAALTQRHFDVALPKDEQRSDWSARPLRESQLAYAAADVEHLIELSERLEQELEARERLAWAQEEFESLAQRKWPARQFDEQGYLRIKGAKRLDPVALSVLRGLYLMRDARAREVDRPPFKVLGNRALLEIAQQRPRTLKELGRIKGVSDLILRRLGKELMAVVKQAAREPHGPLPRSNGTRRRMDRPTERRMTRLKRWRSARASELGMDPGVLCPNSALEAIAWRNPSRAEQVATITELKGWFVREFAGEVVAALGEAGGSREGKDG